MTEKTMPGDIGHLASTGTAAAVDLEAMQALDRHRSATSTCAS